MSAQQPSFRYIMRMIQVLSEHHRIGISDLALLARVNHQRCLINLKWMEQRGFVQISIDNNRKQVSVTEVGADYIAKLASLPMPSETLKGPQVIHAV